MSCIHYDCENRNTYGYCKTSACINPMYSNYGSAFYGQGVQKRIFTNADRIRGMSDDELASLFADFRQERCCPPDSGDCQEYCKDCWLDWLQQEAEDGELWSST